MRYRVETLSSKEPSRASPAIDTMATSQDDGFQAVDLGDLEYLYDPPTTQPTMSTFGGLPGALQLNSDEVLTEDLGANNLLLDFSEPTDMVTGEVGMSLLPPPSPVLKQEPDLIRPHKRRTAETDLGLVECSSVPTFTTLPAATTAQTTTDDADRVSKRQKRLLKNRESAMLSRQRKKAYVDEIERKLAELTRENEELKGTVQKLAQENAYLRSHVSTGSPPDSSASQHSTPPRSPSDPRAAAATSKATVLLGVVLCLGLFFSSTLDAGDSPALFPVQDVNLLSVAPAEARTNGRVLLSTPSDRGGPATGASTGGRTVEDQRQTLLVVLLESVCARIDSTPRLFHRLCAKLFEMGVLDSLAFLEDMTSVHANYMRDLGQLFVDLDEDGTSSEEGNPEPPAPTQEVSEVLKLTPSSLVAPHHFPYNPSVHGITVVCGNSRVVQPKSQAVSTGSDAPNSKALSVVMDARSLRDTPLSQGVQGLQSEANKLVELKCTGPFAFNTLSMSAPSA